LIVIPAKAGIHGRYPKGEATAKSMDPRLRGDDEQEQRPGKAGHEFTRSIFDREQT
jgi:hypothetical protein